MRKPHVTSFQIVMRSPDFSCLDFSSLFDPLTTGVKKSDCALKTTSISGFKGDLICTIWVLAEAMALENLFSRMHALSVTTKGVQLGFVQYVAKEKQEKDCSCIVAFLGATWCQHHCS